MKVLAFTLLAITILLILFVIILPINIKSKFETDYKLKTTPHSDNTNLWAKFPGEIQTKTTHKFDVLDYSDQKLKIKGSLTLKEDIFYDNFNFTDKEDKLIFDAKSNFTIDENTKNEAINTINLGMFELFETLSNPTQYQKSINSLQYLLNKAFPKPDLFIRQIFAYDIFTNIIVEDERIRSTLLKNVAKEKADIILNPEGEHDKYFIKNLTGFYNWIKILGLPEKIAKAQWINNLYNLTSSEIDSIIGENSYLHSYYINFNIKLAYQFDCPDKKACGNEILYNQLISGNVVKSFGLEGMMNLYEIIDPEYYPFSKSPELTIFFEEYKKKVNKSDIIYEDYAPNVEQLNSMIDPSSATCLLSANNSALFLVLNKTDNSYKAYEMYKISTNTLNFMSDYIYEYLPSLFLYQEFKDEKGENHIVDPVAKALAAITQNSVDKTYKRLIDSKLSSFIISEVVWDLLLKNINFESFFELNKGKNTNNFKKIESNEVCPLIMQLALDDGKKVLKVCSDEITAFNSAETLFKWFAPYYCIIDKGRTDCNMSLIDYLKDIIYITDDEIKSIYNQYDFGKILEFNDKEMKKNYNCGEICSDEYLAKLQFWKAEVTKKIPGNFSKEDTLAKIFPKQFPYPVEISYFQTILGETGKIPEEDIDFLISLSPKGENILSEESGEALKVRTTLEKDYTLIMEGKTEKNDTKNKTIDILNKGLLFTKEIKTNYKNIYNIIQGNAEEDKNYVDFLSSGQFFDNFKPKLNQTTGFNFGFDLITGKERYKEYDRYGIYGKQTDTSHIMRKIISINDLPVLNFKKQDYNYLLKDNSIIDSPIFNCQTLIGNKSFMDGFQYEADEGVKYFYDTISTRPLKFNYIKNSEFKDIKCQKYELDKKDLANGINELNDNNTTKAFLSQKLNKPFIITVGKKGLSYDIDEDVLEENYICVDPFTNMVIDSKINFVYSIFTKKYGYINSLVDNEKVLPIFIYQKSYEIDIESYKSVFPNIKTFYTFKLIVLIIGITLIIACFVVAILVLVKLHKILLREDLQKNIPEKVRLINDSSEQTIMNMTENKDNKE